jgi:predicted nucleic acid-binding protein
MLKGSLPEVFLDTDVAFDIISKREPYFFDSIPILNLVANDAISILISESSLANLLYLSFDIYKLKEAQIRLVDFISACEIITGGKSTILEALRSKFKDKEDALQYYTALRHGADYFITRNTRDYKFKTGNLPVSTPEEFIKAFGSN